jgi:class 3 adenylate cyclase
MPNQSYPYLPVSTQEKTWFYALEKTRFSAFLSEWLSNSGHIFVLKSLADIALEGWAAYFTHSAEYMLVFAVTIQAWYLSRRMAHRFVGNLIGVTLYTILDFPVDEFAFFQDFSHIVFWSASLAIALLQGVRYHWKPSLAHITIPLEGLVRTLMIPAFYLVVRIGDSSVVTTNPFQDFLQIPAHTFLLASSVLVGLLLGLQSLHVIQQQLQLEATAKLLKNMAEWGIGSYAVNLGVANPQALDLHPCDRTVVFMDIRGFTTWCEKTSPTCVASVLNAYYQAVEPAAAAANPIRISMTADEVMAIYATPQQGVQAAQAMQEAALPVLTTQGLGAGCGVHCGTVIEGLFGSDDVRTYTVIGDVVNTAKRIESSTVGGCITISDAVYQRVGDRLKVRSLADLHVKGKAEPLITWSLEGIDKRQPLEETP